MLKRFISAITPRRFQEPARIIPRDQHSISREHVSRGALGVMKRLHQAGFEGYLVGGGVRDLLLEGNPKDFDIATDATPEQVKKVFRSARIIGRRFRIVHVRMGRELIEVTTFRAHHSDGNNQQQAKQSDQGMLLRDNVYGDLESDAARRDFTINALYYTSKDFSIYDHTGGLNDIKQRRIRMIGNPIERYKEDPVRMLRAVRFAAKLGFSIEPKTAKPIPQLASLLRNIPASRMFDEVLKLLLAGSALATYEQLRQLGLFTHLFPGSHHCIEQGSEEASDADPETLIRQAMVNTDKRIRNEQRVTPAFIFAALLWPPMLAEQRRLLAKGLPAAIAHNKAAQTVIGQQLAHTTIPKRFLIPMREIWDLQSRLPKRGGQRAERSLEHPRFRAAYDFVLLREQAGEDLQGLGHWWTLYQDADEHGRQQLQKQLSSDDKGKSRRRRKPRRKPSSSDNSTSNDPSA